MSIRISGSQSTSTDYSVKRSVDSGQKGFSQSFQQSMDDSRKRQLGQQALDILDEIEAEAEQICRHADMNAFENYCRRLSLVLSEILENAYLFSTERVFDRGGRQRVFSTVSVIDEAIGQLGHDLINGNAPQLNFLSKIDEIRGLLTDLMT